METLIGNWKLTSSENFDEYMKEIGVNLVMRKLGSTTKPNVRFELNGDEWTFTTTSTLRTHTIKYRLNQEFDEETLDGRKCRTTFTLEDNRLVQTQRDTNGTVLSTLTREITPEGHLRVVSILFPNLKKNKNPMHVQFYLFRLLELVASNQSVFTIEITRLISYTYVF